MDSQSPILVVVAEHDWTLAALQTACHLAREQSAAIVLMKMVYAQHFSWLGTEFGSMHLSDKELQEMTEYQSTVDDYGVEQSTVIFQYLTLSDAIKLTADHVTAHFVFATLPKSMIPFWTSYRIERLRWDLLKQVRILVERPNHRVAAPLIDRAM